MTNFERIAVSPEASPEAVAKYLAALTVFDNEPLTYAEMLEWLNNTTEQKEDVIDA